MGWWADRTRSKADAAAPDVHARLSKLESDLLKVEDLLAHERLERISLVGEVEEHLNLATRRYSKARAAESRAEHKDTNGQDNAQQAEVSDSEARLTLLRSRPSAWGR